MQYRVEDRPPFAFMGVEVRTKNVDEMNPQTAKIPGLWDKFMGEGMIAKITSPETPGTLYGLYSNYESGDIGEYNVTVGTIVNMLGDIPEGMVGSEHTGGRYLVFTTPKGAMPNIVIEGWQFIWQFFQQNTEYKRAYLADFELYDHRAMDPSNAEVDIYIAIE